MTLTGYIATCLLMFVSHAVPSAPGVRPWLIERLGGPAFVSLYSTISLLVSGLFIWGYLSVDAGSSLYSPMPFAPQVAFVVMPLALFLMIGRITSPFGVQDTPLSPQGIYRICRFPGSFGILLWSMVHLLATGDAKRVIAFSTFALIALYALVKNQIVLARSPSEEGRRYLTETSIFPFAASFSGRQTVNFDEIGWRRFLLTTGIFFLLLFLHPVVLGVNPIYWLY